jgi:predicted acyltransferase
VNNPGSWSNVYPPLLHAKWHGWTFTDTVFPFFLWIVGVAMTLSFAKRAERGDGKGNLFGHALRRGATLFLIGFLFALIPSFNWAGVRIPGVLQRIGVCYVAASAIVLWTGLRGQILWIVGLLGGYWAAMTLVPVPGFGPGVLTPEGNLAGYIDRLLLTGHMYSPTKVFDPEGVLSTVPAVATVLFGALAGRLLRSLSSPAERAAWLATGGAALFGAGHLLQFWFPINKMIWTPTYTILMAGLAALVFAACYWLADGQQQLPRHATQWFKPFAIYGMNAITVYVLSGVLARVLTRTHLADGRALNMGLYQDVFCAIASPLNASLLYGIVHVLLLYLVAYALYRSNLQVKL